MRDGEFVDPLLVPVYDAECGWGPDDDFFLSLVNETPNARVLDLGCGTGRLTVALAAAGHTVTGVDPAGPTLDAARSKPGADRVTWIEGTASVQAPRTQALPVQAPRTQAERDRDARLPEGAFDVAVMTSHVAQVFLADDEWARTLAALARALVPGGRLAFDSRDPAGRRWERWNPTDSRRLIRLPDGREVRAFTELTEVRDGTVGFTHHYVFPDGDERLSSSVLRFRDEAELRRSLEAAGFAVERMHGGWARQAVGAGDGELIFVARVAG
ncbi:class I SAM-dependent methyltransferase [Micromonospora sp. NBC_01405]|uniref:class I SAM-dependent methyltransferase n=1 Tax=Micromonospora sp. NBC_01405 TaxID=2903589 RepID=UPI00324EB29E